MNNMWCGVGTLLDDAVLNHTRQENIPVTNFTVVTDDSINPSVQFTTYHRTALFGNRAKELIHALKKDAIVFVIGSKTLDRKRFHSLASAKAVLQEIADMDEDRPFDDRLRDRCTAKHVEILSELPSRDPEQRNLWLMSKLLHFFDLGDLIISRRRTVDVEIELGEMVKELLEEGTVDETPEPPDIVPDNFVG